MSEQQKALTVVERATLALGAQGYEKDLAELAAQSVNLTVITNADGYEQVHAARMRLKTARVEIEKRGKAAREDATAFSKAVIGEERRLIAIISPEEERLQALQKAHDDAKEAERQAKILAEQQRVEKIRARIEQIRGMATTAAAFPTDKISGRISELAQISIDDSFAEFKDEASRVLTETATALQDLHAAAQEREAEQARIAAERAELEQLRAARAKREAAEREQLEAEQRRIATERVELERLRAEAARRDADDRARIAEEEKRSRAAIEAEQAELQRQRAALIAEQKAAVDAREDKELSAARAAAPAQEVCSARPTDDEIVAALMGHFHVDRNEVMEWLVAFAGRRAAA